MTLTHERLLEVLTYEPETGLFRWKKRTSNRIVVGAVAGTPHPQGYVRICIDGQLFFAQRLAVFYMTGTWPTEVSDHRNLDRADNSWDNLRDASNSQNGANAKLSAANKSGFKGVSWESRRQVWQAFIKVDGKSKFLGYFKMIEDAAEAYRVAAIEHFGEFARAA